MSGKRMLHKNICTSEKINSVSEGAECLYYRLITVSDDYGMYYWDPKVVQVTCFPRRNLSIKTVQRRQQELFRGGLVDKTVHDSISISVIIGWEKFQKLRSDREKVSLFGMSFGIPEGKVKVKVSEGDDIPLPTLLSFVERTHPALWSANPNHFQEEWKDYLSANLAAGRTVDQLKEKIYKHKYPREIKEEGKKTWL